MPEQSYSQLMSALSAKAFTPQQLASVYLITGGDDALKREIAAKLQALALDPDFADFDKEHIDLGPGSAIPDGEADPSARILSAAGMAPFMSIRRVVIVGSVQRLPKERQTALADGIKALGALSLLILMADAPEMEGGRPKGRQIEAALKKSAATYGVAVTCDAPQANDLKARAAALFAGWEKQPENGVCDALAEYASTVSANAGSGAVATLTRECEKLRSYVGERERITQSDVEALVPDVAQENIFKLLDAVGARNVRLAMQFADAMLTIGERPDGAVARTLVMLQRHVRMMMLGKFAGEQRLDGKKGIPDELKDMLSSELLSTLTGQSYRVASYTRQAAKFTWDELVWMSCRIFASDCVMKGIEPPEAFGVDSPVPGEDAASNLRLLIAQLCSGVR